MPYSIRKVCRRCSIIYKVLAKEIKKRIRKIEEENIQIEKNNKYNEFNVGHNKVLDDKIYYNNFSVFKNYPYFYNDLIDKKQEKDD